MTHADIEEMRRNLDAAQAALAQAQAALCRVTQDAEEDAADLAVALQALAEADADPTQLVTGEALEQRLAALR